VQSNYHSSQYQNNYTNEQNQQFTEQFSLITGRFQELMLQGILHTSAEAQAAVKAQYDFTCKFWQPNREAFKSLAMTYILPTEYSKYYQNLGEGLGQYVHDAICYWSDQNLD
jgi:hypothetical protein